MFHALKSLHLHLVGLPTFQLEVDAKYIKGMLNNPDMQPNNAINRWIAGILLFNFELVYVPGKSHAGLDGLSRRQPAPTDEEEPQDNWVDEMLELGVWVNSWVEAQAQEKARSTLPHFQRSVGYPTRGQVLMPVGAFIEEVPDRDPAHIRSLRLPAYPFPFLSFTLATRHDDATHISVLCSKADTLADQELLGIQGFLTTTKKPDNLDGTAFQKFLKWAAKFFCT